MQAATVPPATAPTEKSLGHKLATQAHDDELVPRMSAIDEVLDTPVARVFSYN